jgi:hypothetical protein
MRTSDTGLVIGQSYVGKARFWIKSRRTADVVVRLGLTLSGHPAAMVAAQEWAFAGTNKHPAQVWLSSAAISQPALRSPLLAD